jgi:hypothetical protein
VERAVFHKSVLFHSYFFLVNFHNCLAILAFSSFPTHFLFFLLKVHPST